MLQGGADIEVKNNRQQTALMLACTQGHLSVVELLVNGGAKVDAEDEEGHSPLHLTFLRLHSAAAASAESAGAATGKHSTDHVSHHSAPLYVWYVWYLWCMWYVWYVISPHLVGLL